jgi:hypothetical protein
MTGRLGVCLGIAVSACAGGCTIAPKSFAQLGDPAPLVRARAAGLGRGLPDAAVVPTLITRLDDPDAVVRLSAHEELRRRTGRDFGYQPWASPQERAAPVAAWRSWWNGQARGVYASAQGPVVAEQAEYRGRPGLWRRRTYPAAASPAERRGLLGRRRAW